MSTETLARTRTVSWQDPRAGVAASGQMSGIEYLRAIVDGRVPPPPMAVLLGFEIVEVGEGRVVFAVTPGEHHYNPIGMVHGGLAATLCDSAMGCAVHSVLPAGSGYTTLDLQIRFVRAVKSDTGRLLCAGTIVHTGGRVATAEARVMDERGTLYAHATTTCMLFRPERDRRPDAGASER